MMHTSSSGVLAPGLSDQTNNEKVKTSRFSTPKDTFCLVHSKEVTFLSSNYTWNLLIR